MKRRHWLGGLTSTMAALVVGCGPAVMAPVPMMNGVQGLGFTTSNLQMFVEPEAGTDPVVKAITSAKTSVHMKMYMLTEPTVIDALCSAAKKLKGKDGKPTVQVLMEHWVYDMSDPNNIKKIFNARNEDASKQLLAAGVSVQWAKNRADAGSPEWFNLTHEKTMVIDAGTANQTAWIMTANMTNSAFTKNREYLVVDKNKDEADFVEACFQADWAAQPFRTIGPNMVVSPSMGKFANNSRSQMMRVVDSATKTLTIQMEVFNDPDFMQTLGMQVKKGIDVRVTLSHADPIKPGDPEPDDVIAKQLASFGVTQVKFARQITMHAKAIVADGARAYTGSENLTRGSLDQNREMGILTDNPSIVKTLVSCEQKDFAGAVAAPGKPVPPIQPNTRGSVAAHLPGAWPLNDNIGT